MQLDSVLVIYTPRSLAYWTGEMVLLNKDNEIGGSLLISCAEPATTIFFSCQGLQVEHLLRTINWYS